MSEYMVLDSIPFRLNAAELAKRVYLAEEDGELRRSWESLVERVNAIGRPRAVYRDCTVDAVTADTVTVAGVTLKSRVLAAQLGGRRRLFACCATCGRETAELEESLDPLEQFWLEELRMELLRHASAALRREIMSRFGIPRLAGMAPGSGDAGVWPLQEQTKLFDGIFGGRIPELIGVELTDSLLMVPCKSTSGVLFAAEHDFATCRLCRRENCPGRRAPFDPEQWNRSGLE